MDSYFLTILLFIVGAFFLLVGIKILLTKKPIIFSNKYPLFLLLILFLSMLIFPELMILIKVSLIILKPD